MIDENTSMDDLLFEDYVGACRFLRAYTNRLKENPHIKAQDPEWANMIEEVTEALADQIDDALEVTRNKALFNRIVSNQEWNTK